jgi:hypothetical protein
MGGGYQGSVAGSHEGSNNFASENSERQLMVSSQNSITGDLNRFIASRMTLI